MKFFFFIILYLSNLCVLNSYSNPTTILNKGYWKSEINALHHQSVMFTQQNQVKIYITWQDQGPIQLNILLTTNKLNSFPPHLNFKIDQFDIQAYGHLNPLSKTENLYCYSIKSEELKLFLYEFRKFHKAKLTYANEQIDLSLRGSSQILSSLLETRKKELYSIKNQNSFLSQNQFKIKKNTYWVSWLYHFWMQKKLLILGIILVILIIVIKNFARLKACQQRRKALALCFKEITKQADKLYIKYQQLIYQDHYDTLQYGKWNKEVDRFILNRLHPILNKYHISSRTPYIKQILTRKINTTVNLIQKNKTPKFSFFRPKNTKFTGLDYELFCTNKLKELGWTAKRTKQSYDQGADIEAEKNGIKLVIQCKFYNKPIGNSAVQQINAAKAFYFAHYGAVVSNSTYTKSARQLAHTTHIYLLHHDELEKFTQFIETIT